MNRFFFGVVITASMVLQLEDLHGQSNLESQKEAWVEASSDDSLYFERSLDYGWSLYYQGGVYLDTAKMVTFIARDLSEGLNNYISEIASCNLLGEIYRVGGLSDSAIYYSDLAIGITRDNQDTLLRGKLLANKASIYINMGYLFGLYESSDINAILCSFYVDVEQYKIWLMYMNGVQCLITIMNDVYYPISKLNQIMLYKLSDDGIIFYD